MSSNNFNCSAPTPALSPNSDITGIGIIISNIVVAGLAVVIIFVHYLTVYDPTRDPFQKDGQTPQTPFRPNPMDKAALVVPLAPIKYLLRRFVKNGKREKFANSLIKSTRAISSAQIATSFSTLISGFIKLKFGLSTYHWLVIVHLAWLSCLTQLSCLTLLRNYLYDHPIERVLRLLAAGVSVILLIIGLSFTGNYHWAFDADSADHPTLSDYAICHMRARPGMNSAFLSMPFSMILMIFEFASRVVNLYDTLSFSVGVVRIRTFLAGYIRGLLRIVYNWSHASSSPESLKLTLCYLPLLSIYITCLVFVDMWDSAISEVAWSIIAFAFGVTRVIRTIYRPEKMGIEASLTGFNDWSYGQVSAMVFLAVPLITIIGYFLEEDETPTQDETPAQDETQPFSDDQTLPPPELPSISNPTTTDPNDPNNDWLSHPDIFSLIIVHLTVFVAGVMCWTADYGPFGSLNSLFTDGYPISAVPGTTVLILFSLMVDTAFAKRGFTPYACMHFVVKIYSLAFMNFRNSVFAKIAYCLLPLLIIGALAYQVWGSYTRRRSRLMLPLS